MKKLLFAVLVALLFATAFAGCNVYEHEEVEFIRCPAIGVDTVYLPDWDEYDPAAPEF